jgi:thymidylate synthase
MRKIDSIYQKLIIDLLQKPIVDNTRELTNLKFTIDAKDNIIHRRQPSVEYMLAEMIWYFAGKNDLRFISQFASMWKKLSDDGKTNNSAYGYILQHKHNHNQIQQVIDILKQHPESRRAIMNINTPHPRKMQTNDEPCTIALQFLIRNNQLHATGMMRSNDLWFGLPYDIYFFTSLQHYIAKQLNIETGTYTHFATSFHMYIKDDKKIKETLMFNQKFKYKINVDELIEKSHYLYHIVNKDNIIEICKREGVLL